MLQTKRPFRGWHKHLLRKVMPIKLPGVEGKQVILDMYGVIPEFLVVISPLIWLLRTTKRLWKSTKIHIIKLRRGSMTLQDQDRNKKEKDKRVSYDPWDYMPEILDKHAGDMEWMNTHKEEYLKAEEEFVQKVTRALDWSPEFARAWLTRAVWYEIKKDKYGAPYKVKTVADWAWDPNWLNDDYNPIKMEGTTMITTSGNVSRSDS